MSMNIRSLFTKKANLPYWAKGVMQEDYDQMWAAVRKYFSEHGVEIEEHEGEGYIVPKSGYLESNQLGLHNLIRHVQGMKPSEKNQFVSEHFGRFIDMALEQEKISNSDFKDISHLLRIQIHYVDHNFEFDYTASTAGKVLCSNLKACLTFELSNSALTVSNDEVERWGVSLDELFQLALDQTFSNLKGLEPVDTSSNVPVIMNHPDYLFFSSVLLDVNRFASPEPKYGYLIFIPGRQDFLLIPLHDAQWAKQYDFFYKSASAKMDTVTGKVSGEGFWLKNGVFKPLGPNESPDGEMNLAELREAVEN